MAFLNTDVRHVRVHDALCRMLGRAGAEPLGRRGQELTSAGASRGCARASHELRMR